MQRWEDVPLSLCCWVRHCERAKLQPVKLAWQPSSTRYMVIHTTVWMILWYVIWHNLVEVQADLSMLSEELQGSIEVMSN